MDEPRTPQPYGWMIALIGAVLAAVLYGGVVAHPISVVDLDIVDDAKRAAETMPMSRVWLESIPASRPDLGMYRPGHGMLLKMQYEWWPGNIRAFHAISVVLYGLACGLFIFLASRFLSSLYALLFAAALMIAHPLATESVSLASAQNVLWALSMWLAAMIFYQLHWEGHLRLSVMVPLVTICYFLSASAYELGLLLPLALIIQDRTCGLLHAEKTEIKKVEVENPKTHSKKKKRKKAKEEAETVEEEAAREPIATASGLRIIALAVPLLAVFVVLLLSRYQVLAHNLAPREAMQAMSDLPAAARLLRGAGLAGMAIGRLFLPIGPTLFYSPGTEDAFPLSLSIGICIGALALALLAFLWLAKKRVSAMGLALMILPLLAVLHVVPLNTPLNERIILFALPGFALFLGRLLGLAAARTTRRDAPSRMPQMIFTAGLFVVLLYAILTSYRVRQWSNPNSLWEAEVAMHPDLAAPRVYQLMDLVVNARSQPDIGTPEYFSRVESVKASALELGGPPVTDPVYQYLGILYFSQRDVEKFTETFDAALESEGSHTEGFFASVGTLAFQMGDLDRAEKAFLRELTESGFSAGEVEPNYDALMGLSGVYLANGKYREAVERADRLQQIAPPYRQAEASARAGIATQRYLADANLPDTQRQAIYRRAIELLTESLTLNPKITEAWFAMARAHVQQGDYAHAEQVLTRARTELNLISYTELYKIQIASLDKQGKSQEALRLLRDMTTLHPQDVQLWIYAADELIDRGRVQEGGLVYEQLFRQSPNNPDVLVGRARLAIRVTGDPSTAVQFVQRALQVAPSHAGARILAAELEQQLAQSPEPAASPVPAIPSIQ